MDFTTGFILLRRCRITVLEVPAGIKRLLKFSKIDPPVRIQPHPDFGGPPEDQPFLGRMPSGPSGKFGLEGHYPNRHPNTPEARLSVTGRRGEEVVLTCLVDSRTIPPMGAIIFFFFILIVGGLVVVGIKSFFQADGTGDEGEYTKAQFLSEAEKHFMEALGNAVGKDYCVFAKVRLADVIRPKANRADGKAWGAAFARIKSKHLDYLLCDPSTLDAVCGVELDDKSHARADRTERDGFLELAMKGAGVPLARFPVRRDYKAADIVKTIKDAISPA